VKTWEGGFDVDANNANLVTCTDKIMSAFFFNACKKNKGSLNFEQSFKIQSKVNYFISSLKDSMNNKDNQSSYKLLICCLKT
jgi:hypothetical protein